MPAMPGLVSVKTPANLPPLHVAVLDTSAKKDWPGFSSAAVLDVDDPSLDYPNLGPFLLKLARDAIASGEGPNKALDYAIRAIHKSFERCCVAVAPPTPGGSDGGPVLDLAMSLHVLAAIYCSLGRFEEAVLPLERAIQVPDPTRRADHSLAAFPGHIQLGDTLSIFGQIDRSIDWYLEEAYVQEMQFNKAEYLCKKTLEIHPDKRLVAIICEAKGDYKNMIEHLVLASMTMIASGQESEVASIDVSIRNIYMSLCRFDEDVFSYQKTLTVFKSSKGETHPTVASVFVRLAKLYHRTGELCESKSYCENALRIYNKPVPGTTVEEIAGGLTEISAIYESVDEPEEALSYFRKRGPCDQDTLGVYSNLAATYDALERIEDVIEILEQVQNLREEKLETANPDFEDKKKRLAELLKEAGRLRNYKAKSLQNIIDPNARPPKKEAFAKKWPSLGFKF
ncbi:LOW QUALITY PROTEIN: hypothetical protein N665_0048s0019 [Sinapis alba]|nr:LOW QUALITY PROTEIN: hypothetical protein N665_0048s0019 [Sinapis alba]